MNKPIRVSIRVDEDNILRLGNDAAYAKALTEWKDLPWIKFLIEHGEIDRVDHCREFDSYSNRYIVHWQLPDELKTWFYLNYSDKFQG